MKQDLPNTLTKFEEESLLGALLSTGNIEAKYNNTIFLFYFRTQQESIINFYKKIFEKFIKSSSKDKDTFYFRTSNFKIFNKYYLDFYYKKKKTLTVSFIDKLNLEVLFFWALCDLKQIGTDFYLTSRIQVLNLDLLKQKLESLKINYELKQIKKSIQLILKDPEFIYSRFMKYKLDYLINLPKKYEDEGSLTELENIQYDLNSDIDYIINRMQQDGFPYFTWTKKLESLLESLLLYNDFKVTNKIIPTNTVFSTLPNYFMPHRFSYISQKKKHSAIEIFQSKELMKDMIKKTLLMNNVVQKKKIASRSNLRSALMEHGRTPGNFCPLVSKYIYSTYKGNAEKPLIIDLCAGFGGRLFGAWCTKGPLTYIGIDPNTETINCLHQFHTYLRSKWENLEEPNEIKLIHSPMEDVDYSPYKEKVDLIFTSPPYFDTEKYGEEETQSYKRYTTYQSWKENFLKKIVEIAQQILKKDGLIIVNLKDQKENLIYTDLKGIFDTFKFTLVDELYLGLKTYSYQSKNLEKIGIWKKGEIIC